MYVFRTFKSVLRQHALLLKVMALAWVVVLIAKVVFDLFSLSLYELTVPYHFDNTVFMAMGRGILNGLLPYVDLFEIKPPGMFLLSAFSFRLTGGTFFLRLTQVIALLSVPIITTTVAYHLVYTLVRRERYVLLFIAWLFGAVIGLYAVVSSGEFRAESTALPIVLLYAVLVFFYADRFSLKHVLMAAVLLLISVGLKEPFLLTAGAIAIAATPNKRHLLRTFFQPLGLAILAGVLLMLFLNYLLPYLQIYLPFMTGERMGSFGPIWLNTLYAPGKFLADLYKYSSALPVMVIGLWVCLLVPVNGYSVRQRVGQLGWYGLSTTLFLAAVAMAGTFFPQHFLFAIPGVVLLFFFYLRRVARRPQQWIAQLSLTVLTVCLVIAACFHRPVFPEQQFADRQQRFQVAHAAAQEIDNVLDACGWNQYLLLGDPYYKSYGYTQHSPMGPLFVLQVYNVINDYFMARFTDNLRTAELIVIDNRGNNYLFPHWKEYIAHTFTDEPPECAEGIVVPEGHRFVYRLQ